MDYVQQVQASIDNMLNGKGYVNNGANGAGKLIINALLEELGKLNKRIEVLEKEQAK